MTKGTETEAATSDVDAELAARAARQMPNMRKVPGEMAAHAEAHQQHQEHADQMIEHLRGILESALSAQGLGSGPGLAEQLLEKALNEVVDLPPNEVPTVQVQIWLRDSPQSPGAAFVIAGAVKRGPLPRTYVIGAPIPDPRTGHPLPDKIMEICFAGEDIIRWGAVREVKTSGVVGVKSSLITLR